MTLSVSGSLLERGPFLEHLTLIIGQRTLLVVSMRAFEPVCYAGDLCFVALGALPLRWLEGLTSLRLVLDLELN